MSGILKMLSLSREEVGALRDLNDGYEERLELQLQLLDRALAIINDAILHGMPITEEVAEVSNIIRGIKPLCRNASDSSSR